MSYTIAPVSPADKRRQAAVDALLIKEGIRRDAHLDYTCAVYDEDFSLCATGSCFGNTLRCMAVDSGHQGEGLMNLVVSHLSEVQAARGNTHLFLYTKPGSAKFFGDLGFYEIARVSGKLVFMENRRTGFADWLAAQQRADTPRDRTAAVVMNANPFTLGHRHLIERAAAENDVLHLFLLSEDAGPIPFAVRKQLVREGVADLENVILHDSGPYMISSATFPSYFLRDEDAAILAHAKLDLAVFGTVAAALGITARYAGEEKSSHVTALYNETMAAELPKQGVAFRQIPRLALGGETVSASSVRQAIHDGKLAEAAFMLPASSLRYFESAEAAPVIAAIRAMDEARHY